MRVSELVAKRDMRGGGFHDGSGSAHDRHIRCNVLNRLYSGTAM